MRSGSGVGGAVGTALGVAVGGVTAAGAGLSVGEGPVVGEPGATAMVTVGDAAGDTAAAGLGSGVVVAAGWPEVQPASTLVHTTSAQTSPARMNPWSRTRV